MGIMNYFWSRTNHFIPIYGLTSRVIDSNNGSICTDILKMHRQLRSDGRHNFSGLQDHSKLNAEVWAQYLNNYWDWQLPPPPLDKIWVFRQTLIGVVLLRVIRSIIKVPFSTLNI